MRADPLAAALRHLPDLIGADTGAGEARDAILLDLQRANVGRAIVDGGLGAEVRLGIAIGRLLTDSDFERKQTA